MDEGLQALRRMTAGVEAGDAELAASGFAAAGVYEDGFYGVRRGRGDIEAMFRTDWARDGEAYRWTLLEPAQGAGVIYARYVFSFTSRRPHTLGRRAVMMGCCQALLDADGRITLYRDWTTGHATLLSLGVPMPLVAKLLTQEHAAVLASPEAGSHLTWA